MTKSPFLVAGAISFLACAGIASAQTTTLQFETEPCVVTLQPSYTAGPLAPLNVEVPVSAISCPGFTFDLATDALNSGVLTNSTGQTGPSLSLASLSYFDAATRANVSKNVLTLAGGSTAIAPVTYTGFQSTPTSPVTGYVTHGGLNYLLTLAAPVTLTSSAAGQACTVNLGKRLSWRWGQAAYRVVPDSAISCTGMTFSSTNMSAYIPLQSRQQGQGLLLSSWGVSYDPATGAYTRQRELHLYNTPASNDWEEILRLEVSLGYGFGGLLSENQTAGGASGSIPHGPIWGRFSLGSATSYFPPFLYGQPSLPPANVVTQLPASRFSVTPFTWKRSTKVSVKGRRVSPTRISLSISADRNASFQNTTAPTYRRQTVLSSSPADHAVVKRGSKVITRVKLSPYGTATVAVPDIPGHNRYSVTMVATDDNYQGQASITR